MGLTALSGPFLAYGITQTSTGQTNDFNPERGPSLSDLGHGTLDPRFYFNYDPGSNSGTLIYGFYSDIALVDYVPSAISTAAFTVSSNVSPVAGTPITLVGYTSLGAIPTTIIAPETGKAVSVIAIDSTAQYLQFGSPSSGGTVAMWNPAAGTGRTLQITMSATNDTGSLTVAGRDMYGIKFTETLSFTSTNLVTSNKTYKYLVGVTPSSSSTIVSSGISIGFGDTYGMPLLAKYTGINNQIRIVNTSSVQTLNSTGPITLGTTAATAAVSTGPDPRGTYASTTASNGTIRLQIAQAIVPSMVSTITPSDTSAMFGVTPFSSV